MEKMNPDWWKTLFDETYLITDARSVCDEEVTSREVDFLEQVQGIEKSSPILDICGGHGRHSLELSRRGFRDVTVLDYSSFLIDFGRESARREGLNTKFIQSDARDTGLPDQSYRFIIMASFARRSGYSCLGVRCFWIFQTGNMYWGISPLNPGMRPMRRF